MQLPLPEQIDKDKIVTAISPKKDVDGFTPENVGRLAIGLEPYFYPATPQGVIMLLDRYGIPLEGKHAVVILLKAFHSRYNICADLLCSCSCGVFLNAHVGGIRNAGQCCQNSNDDNQLNKGESFADAGRK